MAISVDMHEVHSAAELHGTEVAVGSVKQIMHAAITTAPVGLLLLDQHFLRKECPFAELRIIMAIDSALPVLYNTTYDQLKPLLDELMLLADSQPDVHCKHEDRNMLKDLSRTTMLQTSDTVSNISHLDWQMTTHTLCYRCCGAALCISSISAHAGRQQTEDIDCGPSPPCKDLQAG